MDRLKLAFAVSVVKAVVDADGRTDYAEYKLFGQIFPRHALQGAGLVDAEGRFTERLDELAGEARAVLPGRLSEAEKLDVAALFYGASLADDELDPREQQILDEATTLLGVSPQAVREHLAAARAADER